MKSITTLILSILLTGTLLDANPPNHPLLQSFEIWGKGTEINRIDIYYGWTNGFFQGRGQRGVNLMDCLETQTTPTQAIAMIDKRYKDHPEFWSHYLGEEILDALTAEGTPCGGKNPFRDTP